MMIESVWEPAVKAIRSFSTSERSFHGHPHPLACPAGRTRKSLAIYYYESPAGSGVPLEGRPTVWHERPQIARALEA